MSFLRGSPYTSVKEKRAARRLAKEYAILLESPLENCAASPKVNVDGDITNLFEWHVNLTSTDPELEGTHFHFVMKFPEDYPDAAPKVKPMTYISHPNVFDTYICLDILTMSRGTTCTPYRGWTNAYTVSSILIQLQSFLFEVCPNPEERSSMIRSANRFRCACGHGKSGVFPEIEHQTVDKVWKKLSMSDLFVGCKLRVVSQFDFNNRSHDSTDDFAHIGDQLKVVKCGKSRCVVQRFPQPWRNTRALPLCHLNKVVLIPNASDYVSWFDAKTNSSAHGFPLTKEEVYGWSNGRVEEELKERGIKVKKDYRKRLWKEIMLEQQPPSTSITADLEDDICGLYYLDILPTDVFQTLQTFFTWDELTKLCCASEASGHSMLTNKRLQMQSYRCFYSLMDATDANTILGYGVRCKRMNKRSRKTKSKSMCLQQLHVSFDIMSYEAFDKCNIRNNIWKDCPVDDFLPLYINPEHGIRAMRLNERHLPALVNSGYAFTTDTLIQTYGKAMNTTVVDMMLSVEDVATGELQLMDSIKALEGYMALHHTLLAYALQYPQLVDQCEEYVGRFIHDVHARDKEIVPDIGELLVAMSLTDYTWAEFVLSWLEESMTRNARWTLAKFPNLLKREEKFSCVRLNQTYAATKTSKRLAMFQRFFIERIACPPELEGNPEKNQILFHQYNERCGRPPLGLAEELQRHSRKVLACENWFTFFNLVGFVAPSAKNIWTWLLNAMVISERKEYHSRSNILYFTENHLEDPADTQHCDIRNCMCSGRIVTIKRRKKNCKIQVEPVRAQKNADRLDVAFCVDVTGSMGSWIRSAKEQVKSTIQNLRDSGKQVRFGFVAYKDHSDKELTAVADFTTDEEDCQTIVDQWCASGGGDEPEALATALEDVGGLTWDPCAQRICIIITDAPPHGLGGDAHDSYPEGPPDDSDVFKSAYTLGLAGVALYIVYTGRNGLYESVYRGLARRTGGSFLRLTNSAADCLSKIVLTSSLEEDMLDELAKIVMPYYDQIKARHSIARREQIEYQLHAACVAANVTTTSYWNEEKFIPAFEKQIEDFVLCMDLAHCRTMTENEYYSRFPGSKGSELKKLESVVSKGQIKKVLQRVLYQREMNDIKANGCKFRRSEWSKEVANIRWVEFAAKQSHDVRSVMEEFEPWVKLTREKLVYYGKIPSTSIRPKAISLTKKYYRFKKDAKHLRVEAEEGIHIRSDPTVNSSLVGILENATVIKVLQQKGAWIQHSRGWSEWRRGALSRHTPEDLILFGRRQKKKRAAIMAIPAQDANAWKQHDRIQCTRDTTAGRVSVQKGAEFIVQSVSREKYMLRPVTGEQRRIISVPNNPYLANVFKVLLVIERPESTPSLVNVSEPTAALPTETPAYPYHVGDKLECVPENLLEKGSAQWRLCTVMQIQLFTCMFEHNGKEIKRNLYQYLTFRPAPAPVMNESVADTSPATVLESLAVSETSSSTAASSDTGSTVASSTTSSLSAVYRADMYTFFWGELMTQVVPAQCFVTNQRLVVRAAVNPTSAIIHELPVDTMIIVDCTYKERGHMISPVNGWCWLSSPKDGPLIRAMEKLSTQLVTPTPAIAAPTPVMTESAVVPVEYDYRTYLTENVVAEDVEILSPARWYVTTRNCVVRATLHCRSAKVDIIPAGALVSVDRIYQQRAHVTVAGRGWFWLSSPSGPMVEMKAAEPISEPAVIRSASPVPEPAVIPPVTPVPPTLVFTSFTSNDDHAFKKLVRYLRSYAVSQVVQVTAVDTETTEIEVGSHHDGVTAMRSIGFLNDSLGMLTWKPSYLEYRNFSSQV